jgi:hypothetical protein
MISMRGGAALCRQEAKQQGYEKISSRNNYRSNIFD